jgi:hypothetical protein
VGALLLGDELVARVELEEDLSREALQSKAFPSRSQRTIEASVCGRGKVKVLMALMCAEAPVVIFMSGH